MTSDPKPLASYPLDGEDWDDVVRYGPCIADESALRLLGAVSGRRVLVLGCGSGQPVAALAAAGARVIAVEASPFAAEAARQHCLKRGVTVEIHQRDLAELAFVRAETVDLMVSVFALAGVADLARVFRQVHRVLKGEANVVLSLPHPTLSLVDDQSGQGVIRRRYGQSDPAPWTSAGVSGIDHVHTVEAVVTALSRAGFRVETLLEPLATSEPTSNSSPFWRPVMEQLPTALIVRARKRGM